MLTPLWTSSPLPRRTVPVAADPACFDWMGARFLYEPSDMRLYTGTAQDIERAVEEAPLVMTGKPVFPLADVRPRMLVMALTMACNLRCAYCFAAEENGHDNNDAADAPVVLPRETARRAMRWLDDKRDFTIGFFGGEPLLAFDRLREIVLDANDLALKTKRTARFSLTTNGTLIDDDIARYLDEHRFGLIVSVDGPAGLHDAARPLAGGGGSYTAVLSGLERIAEYPALAKRTTLRGTWCGPDAHLVERLEHLNGLARDYGFGNVSVEPADLSEGCARGGEPVQMDAALEGEYKDAARWFAAEHRAGRAPKFHHFTVRMNRLSTRMPAPSECGAGVGYLTVAPDGTLHACHRLGDSRIGHADYGIDTDRQAPWRDNRTCARKRCPDCWLRNVCGGGCRLNSLHHQHDIRHPDPLGCRLTEVCTQCAAWILNAASRGGQ